MIRLYLDWNVISQVKNGLYPDLAHILNSDNRFLKFFSAAHISDIVTSYSEQISQQEIIHADLKYISILTQDNCILNNIEEGPYMSIYSPHDLFENQIEGENILKGFSLDSFSKSFANSQFEELIQKLIELLKNIPFNLQVIQKESNTQTVDYINTLFPGIGKNPTMGGFIDSFLKLLQGMNNEVAYEDLRHLFQELLNINRDKLFDSKNPFTELQKHLMPITENGIEGLQHRLNEIRKIDKPNWFDSFTRAYISLDIAGFQEDKIEISKKKKKTFRNTTQDAFHSAYATMCDIFIINDKKGYKKSTELYKHYKLNTKVFKPNEFVEYYNDYLKINDGSKFLQLIAAQIGQNQPFIFPNENGKGSFKVYPSNYYFFNYFNKIYVVDFENEKNPNILLSKDKPRNGKYTLIKEIEALVKDLINYFGLDSDSLGELGIDEVEKINEWKGRQWKFDDFYLILTQFNGYFQLYIDIQEKK